MTEHYLGVVGVAEALGVTRHAVHKWRARYPPGSRHPFPEPDVEVDGAPGWKAERMDEMTQWRNGLPGRGAGGGRPTAARAEYLAEAATRGLDERETLGLLAALHEQFPEKSDDEIYAWILGRWRD